MTACEQVLHLGVRTTLQGASEVSRAMRMRARTSKPRGSFYFLSLPIYLASPLACHSRMTSNDIPN